MTSTFYPAYLALLEDGELERRVARAYAASRNCALCGRSCHADRLAGMRGACRTGVRAIVSSFGAHHGEEPALSGWRGSGTLFFGWCNLRCVFCQNWEISQEGRGRETDCDGIASMMLELQARGCHNINLVSPTHVLPQVLASVHAAACRGLSLPLVYNTGGYDSVAALQLLDGVVDIYMPDMKYGSSKSGLQCSRVRSYTAVNRAAVREMHRQVGDLVLDDRGLARRGLLVRHLVLPGDLAGTGKVLKFLAAEISHQTYVNIMDQYHPSHRAAQHTPLDRRVTHLELQHALALARRYGLGRLEPQRGWRPVPAVL